MVCFSPASGTKRRLKFWYENCGVDVEYIDIIAVDAVEGLSEKDDFVIFATPSFVWKGA